MTTWPRKQVRRACGSQCRFAWLGKCLSIVSYSYQRCSYKLFTDVESLFFPDHATISATIPAKMCFCIGLNRTSIHEKLSHLLSGFFTAAVVVWNHASPREIRSARVCAWSVRNYVYARNYLLRLEPDKTQQVNAPGQIFAATRLLEVHRGNASPVIASVSERGDAPTRGSALCDVLVPPQASVQWQPDCWTIGKLLQMTWSMSSSIHTRMNNCWLCICVYIYMYTHINIYMFINL